MGDAYSDMAKDKRRMEAMGVFTELVLDYLTEPNEGQYLEVQKQAEEVDSIRGGYYPFGGDRTDISKNLDTILENLKNEDRRTWAYLQKDLPLLFPKYAVLEELSPLGAINRDEAGRIFLDETEKLEEKAKSL